ncbi:glycosyltransferase [Patescibacteria group bacterium]|nr:glycosyltransferase [Patescibacteria group bacterium]
MKILSIGTDTSLLDKNSPTAKRIIEYGKLADKYTIITLSGDNQIVDLAAGVRAYGVKANIKFLALLKIFILAWKLIKEDNYDVITTQDPFITALVGWLLARKFKVGLNMQIHGDFFSGDYWQKQGFSMKLRLILAKKLLPQADSIRVVSQRIADSLSKFNINKEKIIKAPIYVDWQKLSQTPISADLHKKYPGQFIPHHGRPRPLVKHQQSGAGLASGAGFIILSAGRLVKAKNLSLLINSFKKVNQQFSEIVLVIVGSGTEEEKLKALANQLGLGGKVKFLGWQKDLSSYYKTADLFAVTSESEGYNRTVIEAMACGCPIIMTDVGLAGEIIKDGQNGLVVPVGNQEALTAAIIKIIKDGRLRNNLSCRAQESLLTLPSKGETLALYKKSWEQAVQS